MRTIIAGSRGLLDPELVNLAVAQCGWVPSVVLCGGADGPDNNGRLWAKANGVPVEEYPADWYPNGVYDIRAGYKRNVKMGDAADALIAVWNGKSGGTRHMLQYAKSRGLRVFIYKATAEPKVKGPTVSITDYLS